MGAVYGPVGVKDQGSYGNGVISCRIRRVLACALHCQDEWLSFQVGQQWCGRGGSVVFSETLEFCVP